MTTTDWYPTCWLCAPDTENTDVYRYVAWRSAHRTFLCRDHFEQHAFAVAEHFTAVMLPETGIREVEQARRVAA